MTIWSAGNHLRHPWFDHSVNKRKHSPTTESSSSEESEEVAEWRPIKRQRCSGLEQGLAHLSLQPPLFPTQRRYEDGHPTLAKPDRTFADMAVQDSAMDGIVDASNLSKDPIVLPSSVEEPEPIQEIQMQPSSWYELSPDRIVITDLDSYGAEDEDGNEGTNNITINTNLLEHIKRQQPLSSQTPSPPESSSQALVLFRPLAITTQQGLMEKEMHSKEMHSKESDSQRTTELDEKMDVEPTEIYMNND